MIRRSRTDFACVSTALDEVRRLGPREVLRARRIGFVAGLEFASQNKFRNTRIQSELVSLFRKLRLGEKVCNWGPLVLVTSANGTSERVAAFAEGVLYGVNRAMSEYPIFVEHSYVRFVKPQASGMNSELNTKRKARY